MSTAIPLSNAQQLVDKIAALQLQLQTNAPGYESLLHELHVALHKDEELTHLLTEEQVGIICAGLSKKKNVVIAESSKKTASGGKSLKSIGLGDLGG